MQLNTEQQMWGAFGASKFVNMGLAIALIALLPGCTEQVAEAAFMGAGPETSECGSTVTDAARLPAGEKEDPQIPNITHIRLMLEPTYNTTEAVFEPEISITTSSFVCIYGLGCSGVEMNSFAVVNLCNGQRTWNGTSVTLGYDQQISMFIHGYGLYDFMLNFYSSDPDHGSNPIQQVRGQVKVDSGCGGSLAIIMHDPLPRNGRDGLYYTLVQNEQVTWRIDGGIAGAGF